LGKRRAAMESWATLLRTEVGVPNRSTTQPGVLGVSLLCKKIAFICPVGSLGCSEDKAHPIHSMMITFPLKIAILGYPQQLKKHQMPPILG